jgi:transcription antitermination factor NusG
MSYWVAQCEANREHVAAHFLQLANYQVYLPKTREHRAVRPLFPSYLFIVRAAQWYRARWSVGVTRLVAHGSRAEPTCISDDIVNRVKARERDRLVMLPEPPKLKPGDFVAIQRGVFAGQLGLYAGMRGHERVLVLLQLLGRVELRRHHADLTASPALPERHSWEAPLV